MSERGAGGRATGSEATREPTGWSCRRPPADSRGHRVDVPADVVVHPAFEARLACPPVQFPGDGYRTGPPSSPGGGRPPGGRRRPHGGRPSGSRRRPRARPAAGVRPGRPGRGAAGPSVRRRRPGARTSRSSWSGSVPTTSRVAARIPSAARRSSPAGSATFAKPPNSSSVPERGSPRSMAVRTTSAGALCITTAASTRPVAGRRRRTAGRLLPTASACRRRSCGPPGWRRGCPRRCGGRRRPP